MFDETSNFLHKQKQNQFPLFIIRQLWLVVFSKQQSVYLVLSSYGVSYGYKIGIQQSTGGIHTWCSDALENKFDLAWVPVRQTQGWAKLTFKSYH